MEYRSDLILLLNFGEYNEGRINSPSVDQIPLVDFHGLSYLKNFLRDENKFRNLSDYDSEQMRHVIKAFTNFPVEIRCTGKRGDCKEVAEAITIPYEEVHKHDEQSGPEMRKQLEVPRSSFYCPECSEEFTYNHKGGSEGKGTVNFPISFGILEKKELGHNLDRAELHKELKKIAYRILFQGLEIDISGIEEPTRMYISREQAKEIVNRLLKVPEQKELFEDNGIGYTTRPVFIIKRTSKKIREQKVLNL